MKRYRILPFFDFDTRALAISLEIREDWDEAVKAMHRNNRDVILAGLKDQFGELDFESKLQNFVDLGSKPPSVLAFHNTFSKQVREAFVIGAYYPALTGACALGERILNHLILTLRESFRSTPEYKKVHRKESFDDWGLAIETLSTWEILLPESEADFRKLMRMRHEALHFKPETDRDARKFALEAIACLQRIIESQFSGFGAQPWFITSVPGEIYIKKDWESRPFVQAVYLKNGVRVGPRHRILNLDPRVQIVDPDSETEGAEISDEEFSLLRREFNDGGQKG